jgi:glycosyltransferase involved in cell wall biosynthesis/predicted TPR repeat methyltransferase
MIVKNEEATLERCLASVRGLVDEINIVDTGSDDRTVEIAKRCGARVRSEQWTGDFSHARNISLAMARADWVLILDADEVLAPEAARNIKAAVRSSKTTAYMMPTRNYTDNHEVGGFMPNDGAFEPARHCKGWVESRKIRLFRRRPGIRFEGEIHEVVGPSVARSGGRIGFLDVVVHHFGHMANGEQLKRKFRNMLPSAEAKCRNQKDDYKAHYELGVIHAQLGDFEKAEERFRESIALRADFALARYDLGVLLSRTGREEQALAEFRVAAENDPDNPDALNNLADSLQRLRRDDEAEHIYRTLLERHPRYPRGWGNLGALLARTGRLDEAEESIKRALSLDPDFQDAQSNLHKLEQLRSEAQRATTPVPETRHRPGTISLCMIVRNEENNLERLLSQARRFVDEMIVVDTGSTDATVEIARAHGAKAYEFRWKDDFAAARNCSLSKATGEWILILDADEALRDDDYHRLKNLVHDTTATGFSFETRNYTRDARHPAWQPVRKPDDMTRSFPGWFPSEKVRLFRNSPSIRFEGALHELVEPSILRAKGIIERTDIPIHHYGGDKDSGKAQAYLEPAQHKAKLAPDNAQAHFELGVVLHRNGKFGEACSSFEKAVGLAPENAEYRVAHGESLRAAHRFVEAEKAYRSALKIRPDASEAYSGLGITLFRQGAIIDAQKAFETALELNPRDSQSLTNLGVICVQEGTVDDAIAYFKRSLAVNPQNATARSNLETLSSPAVAPQSLGLIMIVKNERENLSAMLPELASCFDEVVIVDTGSADDTVALARRYTERVFQFPWNDDFSAARNFALAQAGSDWVLWLDADDRMPPEDIASLRQYLGKKDKAYMLRVKSGIGGSDTGEFFQIRLFPNKKGIAWEGRVHEQLLPSLKHMGIQLEAIRKPLIMHTGYHEPAVLEKKTRRNVVLLEKERTRRPHDRTILHHLGQAYAILGEIAKAIETSERLVIAHGSHNPDEILTHTMNRLVQYHLMLDDIETARKWADRVLELEPENPLVCHFLGEIYFRKGLFREAVEWLERFRNARKDIGFVPVPWERLGDITSNFRGICYDRLGDRERARAEFEKAVAQSDRIEPYKNLAHLHLRDGHPEKAEAVLREAIEIEESDADIWTNLGVALARSRKYEEAERACRRAIEIEPTHELARKNLENIRGRTSPAAGKGCELSLNMIVRNEEQNIRECLSSIAGLFDEMVIVDTGSTDGTATIARKLGARVIHVPWNDNFSDARNAALEHTSGKWVFWLDADDRLDAHAVRTLRSLIARSIPCGAYCTIESPTGENGGVVQNYTLRLFPNRADIRWSGAVHEQIVHCLHAAGIELLRCEEFTIRHIGYRDGGDSLKKSLRNLKLLANELAARPEDPYILLSLGQEFLVCGQAQHAARWLHALWKQRADTNGNENGHLFWAAAILLSECALRAGAAYESEAWLGHAVEIAPHNWLAYFLLGERKLQTNDTAEAVRLLARAEELGPGPTLLPLDVAALTKKLERYLRQLRHPSGYIGVDAQES